MTYDSFLETKRHSIENYGIDTIFLPDNLFPFQRYVSEYVIKKGRCACFLDTGMGKTIIELIVATNYVRKTNRRALIMTPLAVASQMIKEAYKFNIDDVQYSKDGKSASKIVITNYERLHYFDANDFDCVICDESSILKNFEGAIKNEITTFIKKVKYRFLFTATPSPNDFIELGTSSEALGHLGYTDMLTKYFTNNEDTISPMNIGTKWILKGHAHNDFFKWVSSWSISARKPSDLGFDDSTHVLPNLIEVHHLVKGKNNNRENGSLPLFDYVARTQKEINSERSQTISERCERAVFLAKPSVPCVYWCNLNNEGDLLEKMDDGSRQISGSMSLDEKEEILNLFSEGKIDRLITKPKMTAFGLNWQHCSHTIYFPTFSYEQYYQSIRRFWRFGQAKDVTVDIVLSTGQQRVVDSILAKSEKSNRLFSKLNASLHEDFNVKKIKFDKKINPPSFLI